MKREARLRGQTPANDQEAQAPHAWSIVFDKLSDNFKVQSLFLLGGPR
jgi:hypothetical protein